MALRIDSRMAVAQTDTFGPVLVDSFTNTARQEVGGLLDKAEFSDEEFARALFRVIIRLPNSQPTVQECPLSEDEVSSLSVPELEAIATAFLKKGPAVRSGEKQGWKIDGMPLAALRKAIRAEGAVARESEQRVRLTVAEQLSSVQDMFSNSALKAFQDSINANSQLQARLKEFRSVFQLDPRAAETLRQMEMGASRCRALEEITYQKPTC